VWKLVSVPILEQVDQLVAEKEYEEALSLCENIPDSAEKTTKIKSIKVLFTYHLFAQGHYDRSMELFKELECDPLQIIGLYPNMLPREMKSKFTYPIAVEDLAGAALEKAFQALVGFLLSVRPQFFPKKVIQRAPEVPLTRIWDQQEKKTME